MERSPANKRFEPINLAAGPRPLPSWVRDAHINWMEGYSNSPYLKVRCAVDPLEFSRAGEPVWEQRENGLWIAERGGVAHIHWHSGRVALTDFERHVRWIEDPSRENNWKGEAEVEKYQMLATTQQEGYAGRHFDITLKDGTPVRLRGPWHGPSPAGYMEISFDIDADILRYRPHRHRPHWYQRGGYFGLYIKPEIVLDVFATFQPHVPWATIIETRKDAERRWIEPMRPETQMPKGWFVSSEDCPGHRYSMNGGKPKPYDSCAFCCERRDPDWSYGKAA